MSGVNWWLMALSFALGLGLTLLLTIRRVKAEVPAGPRTFESDEIYPEQDTTTSAGRGAAVGATGTAAAVGLSKVVGGTADGDDAESDAAVRAEPYGPGSARVALGADAPSGWAVKGDEDVMVYHTPDSPGYDETITEVWFQDEDVASKAGFVPWSAGFGDADTSVVPTVSGDADTTVLPAAANAVGAVGISKFASTSPSDDATREIRVAPAASVPPGPYGVGSARAGAGGSGPQGWTVKGNENSMLYHTLESPYYKRTIAEVWFVDEESATKAGFDPWHKNLRKR